uniref:Uncharacterized protein n=1 Tax=Mesocestoides corti TaxID=53468 RepID=A0A5K3EUM5_MESCO
MQLQELSDEQGCRCIEPLRPRPINLPAFELPVRKLCSQPETRPSKKRNINRGAASAVELDGRRPTYGSDLRLVKKACSVVPLYFILGLGYSTNLSSKGIFWVFLTCGL